MLAHKVSPVSLIIVALVVTAAMAAPIIGHDHGLDDDDYDHALIVDDGEGM